MHKAKYYFYTIFSFVILFFLALLLLNHASQEVPAGVAAFTINYPSGFYSEELTIEISSPKSTQVYYTMDGSFPSADSASSMLYQAPISLPCYRDPTIYTLKFLAVEADTVSPVHSYTYITGTDIAHRFDTLVVSISGDEEALFGYESGIFVEGKLRHEYLSANPELDIADPKDPANYNLRGQSSERPVTVSIFDSQGNSLLTQHCGIRISGNYTRGKRQKSFQLFPRKFYDVNGTFHASLFPDIRTYVDGSILNEHNRLLFRNSGDDFNHAFIRDTLIQSLANQYQYPFTYTDRPVAVFLNGNYQGVYWMREPFQNGYVENMYGFHSGEFITLSIDEYNRTVNEDPDPEKQTTLKTYQDEYQELYDSYCYANLFDDTVFNELSKLMDIENFLQYFAIELYIGNKDWPYNNVKAYRYVSSDGKYDSEGIFDGRYRYLLFDTDYSFHLEDQYTSYSYDEDNLALLSTNDQSLLFSNLMGRKDCRDYFINTLCDLMNGSFHPDNVCKTLQHLDAQRSNELRYFLENSPLPDSTVSMATVKKEVDHLLDFANNRPPYMHQFITADFPISADYQIYVRKPSDVQLSVNSLQNVTDDFQGTYYAECGLRLTAITDLEHSFAHYIINDVFYPSSELVLSEEELLSLLQGKDTLEIEVITESISTSDLYIRRISSKGVNDYVVLFNPSNRPITLDGLYLSDDPEKLKKSSLPAVTLSPGENLTIYGQNNNSSRSASQYRLHFNLKKGETLFLSNESGSILQTVLIPSLCSEYSVYELDTFSRTFYERILE